MSRDLRPPSIAAMSQAKKTSAKKAKAAGAAKPPRKPAKTYERQDCHR